MTNSSATQDLIYSYLTTGCNTMELNVLNAIRVGLEDIYQKPYLLNYIFLDLLHEPLNIKYGNGELLKIKQFFSTYKVPIVYGAWLNTKTTPPFVAVRLISSNEVDSLKGLGEENAMTEFEETETIPQQQVYPQPYIFAGPFSPQYDSTTGIVTLPDGFTTTGIFVGECLQSANGNLYPVLSLISSTSFTIATDIKDNFTNSTVVLQNPDPNLIFNFFFFDEIYEIMCVTGADSAPLFWLTSVIKFILLRYRRQLLEKYNVALSSISMGKSELLEVQDTNVQLLTQPFTLKCRIEQRILVDVSGPVRGITGTINAQIDSDPDFIEIIEVE